MLYEAEIQAEIEALENRKNHNASTVAMLADLYTIRDHMIGDRQGYDMKYSEAPAPERNSLELYGDSDFLTTVSGKDISAAWKVMDELMNTLYVANPKVYDSVLRKIRAL